ncbi:hypothetical protein PZA11_007744 [Diplocarpon coronariae]|nr:hypothetical protein JHW43_002609 [Diplocarpon mali]
MRITQLISAVALTSIISAETYSQNPDGHYGQDCGQNGTATETVDGLTLLANLTQTGSQQDGSVNGVLKAGQSASQTSKNNFINICSGKTVTNGVQVVGGSCNGIPMGDLPAKSKMVSAIIIFPETNGKPIRPDTDFNITVHVANLVTGVFTNPNNTYYAAPQELKGGKVVGHVHVTVQDLGSSLNPKEPLDATKFAFFKGINDAGNGKGLLKATVTGGLPAGNYRVCTVVAAANHQPVLMPVAQRGAADDCTKFVVGGSANVTVIDPSLRLRRAIHSADTLLVRRILKTHPSLLQNPDSTPTGLSNTNLHLASSLGHTSIVSLLLSLYRPANTPPTTNPKDLPALSSLPLNEEYQTPLHLASANGHTEIVHLLCAACPGCIKRGDSRGRDALMLASKEGHDTVVQILLTFSPSGPEALLEGADLDGNTALHFASSNGHLLVLRTLLAAGADSERRNVWSWTPVAYSATVQAEVYFKGLVGEVERRKAVRREVKEKGTGGSVRVVSEGEEV